MTWDSPITHQVGSWLGINVTWLKPILAPIAIWLDDFLGPYPTDRKLGLKIAREAETVAQAKDRRKAGGEITKTYIPSYRVDNK